jgi:pyruvate kinase
MVRMARVRNKFSIVATQMMESMIESPVPTRAEVSDVANAVLDGTDAVMLSAESATGAYPVEAVEAMAKVCVEAEKAHAVDWDGEVLSRSFSRIDHSVAMSSLVAAHHLKAKAIATLTESGATALAMSRVQGAIPIYAVSAGREARARCAILRGVHPIEIQPKVGDRESLLLSAEELLVRRNLAAIGDTLVLTVGEPLGQPGGTNTMKVVSVRAAPLGMSSSTR